jgi:Polyketide cyclase / dehydrase and lipid transport
MLPLLLATAFVALIFFVVIAGRPDEFVVSRTNKISAPPENVFPLVAVIKAWEMWSPWAKLDPNAMNTYEGPASGVGAAMAWEGNKKVGAGRMSISESRASELIRFRLEFFRPFKAINTTEFTFISEGGQTVVTWSMSGKNNFMGKAMGLVINCDKMVGGDFERGLASLKSIAEAAAKG